MENKERMKFPLDSFPDNFKHLILHYETSKKFDINLQALATMVHIASLLEMGTRFSINGFEQPPIIWGNMIQDSGEAKSHLMRHCLSYLNKKNDELHREEVNYSFVTNHTTIEGMFKKHKGNRKGLTIFKDELSGWVKGMNNYQSNGAKEEWMNAWNGGSQTLTRSESVHYTPDCKPNLMGATPPEKVPSLFDSESLTDGFSTRFLNTEPYYVGKKYKPITKADNKQLAFLDSQVHERIWKMEARTFVATEEGDKIWRKWCDEGEDKYFDFPQYRKYQKKLESYAIRISGILHVMGIKPDEPLPMTIKAETVQKALVICDFFMGQYERVLNNLSMHRFPDKIQEELNAKRPEFQTLYMQLNGLHYRHTDLCKHFESVYNRDNMKAILKKNILFKRHEKDGQRPTYTRTLKDD